MAKRQVVGCGSENNTTAYVSIDEQNEGIRTIHDALVKAGFYEDSAHVWEFGQENPQTHTETFEEWLMAPWIRNQIRIITERLSKIEQACAPCDEADRSFVEWQDKVDGRLVALECNQVDNLPDWKVMATKRFTNHDLDLVSLFKEYRNVKDRLLAVEQKLSKLDTL